MKNAQLNPITVLLFALLSVAPLNMGWANSIEDKVKEAIDDASQALKNAVDKLGDDFDTIQNYLDNYHWKGIIQDEATSGAVTLKNMHLNGHSKAVVVKPGERIEGVVQCDLDREQCESFSFYRVVLGIKGKGAQTTIGNELGIVAGKSEEKFVLIAPSESGLYQIRFRLVDALLKKNALESWTDENGDEPDGTTTIGLVFVKS